MVVLQPHQQRVLVFVTILELRLVAFASTLSNLAGVPNEPAASKSFRG